MTVALNGSGRDSLPIEGERVRAIKQEVLSDVSCVLARAAGADIAPRHAFLAARNVCEILFSHPQQPSTEIPKMFWETPLGRAVGVCCGDSDEATEAMVKTTLHLPHSVSEKLRLESEMSGKPVSDIIAERLSR